MKKKLFNLFIIMHLLSSEFLYSQIIQVTSTDGGQGGSGTLNDALQQAQYGDIIDCSPIAGQTIYVTTPLPAIGYNATSSTPPVTINGSGVIIDGGGVHPVFSLGQGSAVITDLTIQNGVSSGGSGGAGQTGGGGGTGGGGALYVNSGATLTISTLSLNNNQAVGGNGGAGGSIGGAGGGGGGFGGGHGGNGHRSTFAGSGGGGGGNNGGASGGNGGAGSPNTFSNFAGAGGGGAIPGNFAAGAGGSAASSDYSPAHSGGAGGLSTITNGAGAGGGAGSAGSGSLGSDAIPNGDGIGGAGGYGFGSDNSYGAGGGGGGGNDGGAGHGTSGGGGGFNGFGGVGGAFGGGGGASAYNTGGNGGFGAGGGAGYEDGGTDMYSLGGQGGSAAGAPAGGGGGSGFGGAIFIQRGGALIIQDGISFSGNSTTAGIGGVATGMGSGGDGSSLGQDIFIQSGGSVTFQINDTLTMSTPIEGGGLLSEVAAHTLIKSGAGNMHLMGNHTYLGDTLVQSGMLRLNGSVSRDLYIESAGTLSGNATALGNIYNSGTISPGNSIGQVFTTDLSLTATSIYNVEVNSADQSDTITASGSAQVDGAVIVTPDDLNFTTPLTYTIVSAATGVTGEFSSLSSTVPSLMNLTYNLDSVQLIYIPLQPIGLKGNAFNAANAFVASPVLPGSDAVIVNNALLALSFDDMQIAFDQMSPAQFSGPAEIQLLDAILVRSTYSKHVQKFRLHNDEQCDEPKSLWFDGFAQWQNQKNLFGYDDTTLGATLGFDYSMHNWFLGAALSSTYDTFDWKDFGGNANINSYYAGLYSSWNSDGLYMNMALLGALNKYKTTRQLYFGTINRSAESQHDGNDWLAHVGFEYLGRSSHLQCSPYVNLDYVSQHENGYSETGASSLDLQVNSKNSTLFQGEIGVVVSATCHTNNGRFIPMLSMAYINQTPCSSNSYYASFAGSTSVFAGAGGNYERNLFVPRLACNYQGFCDGVNISIYYDAQVGSGYWAQGFGLDYTFRF